MQDTEFKGNRKKSSLIYHDYLTTVERLDDTKAGILFKRILFFFNGTDIDSGDNLVELAFAPYKQQIIRDHQKYLEKCEKNRQNIKSRWEKKERDNTNVFERIPMNTNYTDTDTDTDTDKDIIVSPFSFSKQLLKEKQRHASWAEGIHMRMKLKKGAILPLLTKFDGHLKVQGKIHKNIEEYKKHFSSWLNYEQANGRLKEHEQSKVGML